MGQALAEKQESNVLPMSSTDQFITQAIQSNAPVETMEKLFALKERHEASEARKGYFIAMQEFQNLKPELKKSKEVKFNSTSYKFCPLSDMERQLKEPMYECGLSYRFEHGHTEDGRLSVTCVISHVQGHVEKTTMSAPADDSGNKNGIQGLGSTSTYLMRYTLIAALGLTTADEDNDGTSAGDMPYQMVLEQNKLLQDPEMLEAVAGIKKSLAEGDYYTACTYIYAMPQDVQQKLWLAPSKGGLFTTAERKTMKEDGAFANARADYFAEKDE